MACCITLLEMVDLLVFNIYLRCAQKKEDTNDRKSDNKVSPQHSRTNVHTAARFHNKYGVHAKVTPKPPYQSVRAQYPLNYHEEQF